MAEFYLTKFDKKYGLEPLMGTLGDSKTTQIFVHSIRTFGNIHDEKALLMARRNDIVCTSGKVDDDYLEFLSDLGVGPNYENIITVPEISTADFGATLSELLITNKDTLMEIQKKIKSNNKIILNPYKSTHNEIKVAEILGSLLNTNVHINGGDPKIVEYINLKHNSKSKAVELGLPVAEGETIRLSLHKKERSGEFRELEKTIRKKLKATGRAIVRGSYGSSGSSIEMIRNDDQSIQDSLNKISKKNDNQIYLVEEMLDIINSTNIIFHIGHNRENLRCVSATDQILNDKLEYKGSTYPSEAQTLGDMIGSARQLSLWLQSKGYSGLVGFDFGEYTDSHKGETKYFFAEINPRVNASAYPRALMDNLNLNQKKRGWPKIEAFLSTKVEADMDSFTELKKRIGRLFYKPETGKGLVPYNIGRLENGMFNAVFFGKTPAEISSIFRDMKRQMYQDQP
ncbi:ATP-grasp domain-containing protein [Thermodesulfobacteriota bacterium]